MEGDVCYIEPASQRISRESERWRKNVILIVMVTIFTSIRPSYFTSIAPKVKEFSERFVERL